MLQSLKPHGGKRWPRGQRFSLAAKGVDAEAGYRAAVHEAKALGREALDAAERRWATPLGLAPGDGVVLMELRPGRLSIADLCRSLDACGTTSAEIRQAIDRLVDAGLVDPLRAPSQAAA